MVVTEHIGTNIAIGVNLYHHAYLNALVLSIVKSGNYVAQLKLVLLGRGYVVKATKF
jgi:hypothetical protein